MSKLDGIIDKKHIISLSEKKTLIKELKKVQNISDWSTAFKLADIIENLNRQIQQSVCKHKHTTGMKYSYNDHKGDWYEDKCIDCGKIVKTDWY